VSFYKEIGRKLREDQDKGYEFDKDLEYQRK
jgi:hypothetical protein